MHTRLLRYGVLALGAPLALSACGGGSSPSPSSTASGSTTTTVKGSASQTALRDCLQQHGVTLPAGFGNGGPPSGGPPSGEPPGSLPAGGTPGSLPAGVDQQKLQSAIQACGGTGNKFPGAGQNSQAFQAYTSCLGDHGIKVGKTTGSTPPTFDRTSAAFIAANKACAALLPSTSTTTAPSN
jgi:hypothetical protein